MKDPKNLFNVDPSEEHLKRVQEAVGPILKERRLDNRRKWFAWFLIPAFASLGSFFIFRKTSARKEISFLAELELIESFEDESDLDMVADLEVIDDLEFLEDWDGSEEA
jgi:hypothetical protein